MYHTSYLVHELQNEVRKSCSAHILPRNAWLIVFQTRLQHFTNNDISRARLYTLRLEQARPIVSDNKLF